ncbi:MAG: hypothetical protein U1A22_05245 [Xanthomonadaceae bacterium]|nr:hypothetical protein [Xanthomonadaceae bacterium]
MSQVTRRTADSHHPCDQTPISKDALLGGIRIGLPGFANIALDDRKRLVEPDQSII